MENDCKDDDKCKVDIYDGLRKDIYAILCPHVAPEQLNPRSWSYAVSRQTVEKILDKVKIFIEK